MTPPSPSPAAAEPELSVVMPCLNEARTIGRCINKANTCLRALEVNYEIIVADNGSDDGSVEIAREAGARVVFAERRGYGAALKQGIGAARGTFVIMGDCDDSYDFSNLGPFIEELRKGHDLVMGNRFKGGIEPGAMPVHHRYFGNPLLTFLGRMFFKTDAFGDFYCGLRGFNRESIRGLNLHSDGMEFALEMVIKACMHGYRLTEVPTTLSKDGRDRPPHLKSIRDGWRSLRFYLLMAPRWIFGLPGLILLGAGGILTTRLAFGPLTVGSLTFDYHTLLYSSAAVILGYQAILFAVFAKLMAIQSGLHPKITKLRPLDDRHTLGHFLLAGGLLATVGLALAFIALRHWAGENFGDLESATPLRVVILSVLFLLLGGQTTLAGFYFGLYNLIAERLQQMNVDRI